MAMSGRERILIAARDVFARKPYAEASIAPILEAADLQAPTLYYHFGDKEGLYVTWAEEAFAHLKGILAFRSHGDLSDGLAAFATLYFSGANLDVGQVLRDIPSLSKESSRDAVYTAYFQSVYEPLCAILIDAMESGTLPPEPIGPIADIFLNTVQFLRDRLTPGSEASTARWLADKLVNGFAQPA
jgi:TetR/AcrR family transcriptional regulator